MFSLEYNFDEELNAYKKEGIAEGIERGEKSERLAIARKMKAKNLDVSLVAEMTGLTLGEITQLWDVHIKWGSRYYEWSVFFYNNSGL